MNPVAQARILAQRYRLEAVIGRGGMGTVWRAHDLVLTRDVAIKEILWPPFATEAEHETARRRALREAQMAARLWHPNVVGVYDIVEEDDRPWIVMELLPYRSLRDIVREDGPLPPSRAAELGMGVLAALRAAHREGILHRDVKPGNILVGPDGRVVLTDFGIARAVNSATLTTGGMLIGSPSYIAPERALGGPGGPASDLWGLGASLYTAVEGRPPFEREGALPSLTAVVADEPDPPVHAGPLLPLINGLLAKDPGLRLGPDEAERMLRQAGATSDRRPGSPGSPPPGRPGHADAAPALPAQPAPQEPPSPPAPAAAQPANQQSPAAQESSCPPAGGQDARRPAPPDEPVPSAPARHPKTPALPGLAAAESPPAPGAVATAPGARARERLFGRWFARWRGRRGVLAGAAAVVVAAGTGTALALTSSPGHQTASPPRAKPSSHAASPSSGAPASSSSGVPASGTTAPAPSTGAAGSSGSAGGSAGTGTLPAGYYRFTNSTGFSIGVPQGWKISHAGHYVYVKDPANPSMFLLIDQSDQPKANPLADWEQQQANRRGTYPDYHLIRLAAVSYPQAEKAADWEFTYMRDGVLVHILNRNILANARHAYALYWSTPESDWDADYHYFHAFAATFRPAPA